MHCAQPAPTDSYPVARLYASKELPVEDRPRAALLNAVGSLCRTVLEVWIFLEVAQSRKRLNRNFRFSYHSPKTAFAAGGRPKKAPEGGTGHPFHDAMLPTLLRRCLVASARDKIRDLRLTR